MICRDNLNNELNINLHSKRYMYIDLYIKLSFIFLTLIYYVQLPAYFSLKHQMGKISFEPTVQLHFHSEKLELCDFELNYYQLLRPWCFHKKKSRSLCKLWLHTDEPSNLSN